MTPLSQVLWPSLWIALGLFTVIWMVSVIRRDASIVDMFWGPGFMVVAVVYAVLGHAHTPRAMLTLVLVAVWGLRLAVYIGWRGRGRGEDYRYREMREKAGKLFPWLSLVSVFWLQAAILWVVSWPLAAATRGEIPSGLTWLDGLGTLLWVVGFIFEAGGDLQLARFKADPANRGRVLDAGFWRYTRHPNYFGDACVWWGLTLIALAAGGPLWVLVSPVLMTFLLMRVSGVTLLEKNLQRTKPAYRDYVRRTSAFFPWPPGAE